MYQRPRSEYSARLLQVRVRDGLVWSDGVGQQVIGRVRRMDFFFFHLQILACTLHGNEQVVLCVGMCLEEVVVLCFFVSLSGAFCSSVAGRSTRMQASP